MSPNTCNVNPSLSLRVLNQTNKPKTNSTNLQFISRQWSVSFLKSCGAARLCLHPEVSLLEPADGHVCPRT